jgi:YHS domain-containing protein
MVQLLDYADCAQSQPVLQNVPKENTYILKYRGTTYEMSQSSAQVSERKSIEQSIGKRLTYRGTTYEIVLAAPNPTTTEDSAIWKLQYRGVTYWSTKKATQKLVEYVVV